MPNYARFIVTEGQTYTLSDGSTYTNPLTYSGSGALGEIQTDGILIASSVSFIDNSASSNGGAIMNSGTASCSESTFSGNTASTAGAIFNGDMATFSGSKFNENRASDGGAIFNDYGTILFSNSTFSGNSANTGGAVYNCGGMTTISTSTFNGNIASHGGAIYNGGAICNDDKAKITDSMFSGNTATLGGAICNHGIIEIAGSTFSGNKASTAGAIYNDGKINMTNTIALQTGSDTIYNAGILNWDLSNGTISYGKLVNYQYLTNADSLTITVSSEQSLGDYIIATGDFTNVIGKDTFNITGVSGENDIDITINGENVFYNGLSYALTASGNNLILSVDDAGGSKSSVSDYNGSGKSDMIQFVNGLVYVTYDTSIGYVQTPAINDVTGWNVVEIRRDLTGDGFADIQITSDDGAGSTWVATLRNDYLKNGCITLNYQFIGAYNNKLWSYLGSADFNADGCSEILMIQTDEGADGPYRHVVGWITDEENCLWTGNIWLGSLTNEWNIAGTADVTGDGADNVLLRRADGMIGYWSKAGTNNIVELKNAGNRILLTTGDFDGDGTEDFLWKSIAGDEFSVWSDLGGDFTDGTIGKLSDLGDNWLFAGVGDYNGDGKDEILWCDTSTYKTAYAEGNKENFKNLTVIV